MVTAANTGKKAVAAMLKEAAGNTVDLRRVLREATAG